MGDRHRVVVICGPDLPHRHTCAVVIERGVDVVGICTLEHRLAGLPLRYVLGRMSRVGPRRVVSQVLARLWYLAGNARRDRESLDRIFDAGAIEAVLGAWKGRRLQAHDIASPEVRDWIAAQAPDVILVHCGALIPPAVLRLAKKGIVIGGHPGLTPYYRGSHSSFWAILKGAPEDVGWSVMLLDEGVDTGGILAQGRLMIEPSDSFVTLGWKGMKALAIAQAELLIGLDRGERLMPRFVRAPAASYFDNPTLREYAAYRRTNLCR